MTWTEILVSALAPHLLDAAGILLASVMTLLTLAAKKAFGLEVEKRHAEKVHGALMSGLKAALEKGPQAGREALVEAAIEYAKESVPDALKALKPPESVLRDLATSKIGQAKAMISAK